MMGCYSSASVNVNVNVNVNVKSTCCATSCCVVSCRVMSCAEILHRGSLVEEELGLGTM